MDESYEGKPAGDKPSKSGGQPDFTKKFAPGTGGYEGSSIESEGGLGDKAVGAMVTVGAGNLEEGDYNTVVNAYPPNIPHGTPDPSIEGPPLASTPEDPTRAQY